MRPSLRIAAIPSRHGRRTHLPGGSGGVWYADDPVLGPVVHRPDGAMDAGRARPARVPRDAGPRRRPHACIGFDAEGREVLSFVCRDALDRGVRRADRRADRGMPQPGCVAITTSCATGDPASRVWRQTDHELGAGELICHNDPGTYNWVIRRRPVRRHDRLGSGRAGPSDRRPRVPLLDGGAAVPPVPGRDAARRVRRGGALRTAESTPPRCSTPWRARLMRVGRARSRRASIAAIRACCRCANAASPRTRAAPSTATSPGSPGDPRHTLTTVGVGAPP